MAIPIYDNPQANSSGNDFDSNGASDSTDSNALPTNEVLQSSLLTEMSNVEVNKFLKGYLQNPDNISFENETQKAVFLNHSSRIILGKPLSVDYFEDSPHDRRLLFRRMAGTGYALETEFIGKDIIAELRQNSELMRFGFAPNTLLDKLPCVFLIDFNLSEEFRGFTGLKIAEMIQGMMDTARVKKNAIRPVQIGIYTSHTPDDVIRSSATELAKGEENGKIMLGPFYLLQKGGEKEDAIRIVNHLGEMYLKGMLLNTSS